jgi:hypothetical protein
MEGIRRETPSVAFDHYSSFNVPIDLTPEVPVVTRFNELQEAYHEMENARLEMEEALQSSQSSIINDHPSHEPPSSPLQDDDQQSESATNPNRSHLDAMLNAPRQLTPTDCKKIRFYQAKKHYMNLEEAWERYLETSKRGSGSKAL